MMPPVGTAILWCHNPTCASYNVGQDVDCITEVETHAIILDESQTSCCACGWDLHDQLDISHQSKGGHRVSLAFLTE